MGKNTRGSNWTKPATKYNQKMKGKNDEVNGEGEECSNTLPKRKYNNNNNNNNNNYNNNNNNTMLCMSTRSFASGSTFLAAL